jgi:hypothetical protein
VHPLANSQQFLKKISETSIGLMRSTRIVQKFFFDRFVKRVRKKIVELVKRGRLLNRSCSLGMVSAQIWVAKRFGDVNPIRVQTSSLLLHFVSTLQSCVRIVRVLGNVERDLELKRVKVTARTPTQPD